MDYTNYRLASVDFYIEPLIGTAVFMGYNTLMPVGYGGTGNGVASNKNLMQALTFWGASVLQKLAFNQGEIVEVDDHTSYANPIYGIRALRTGLMYSTLATGLDNDSRSFIYKTLIAAGADYVAIRTQDQFASKLNLGGAVTGEDNYSNDVALDLSESDGGSGPTVQ